MKTFIEVKTGIVYNIDDSTEAGKKEYLKKSQSEEYIEWFCFGVTND